jgi:hypothetical protein
MAERNGMTSSRPCCFESGRGIRRTTRLKVI